MPELNLDFSNVQDLEEGWHSATIVAAVPDVSSNGNHMLKMQYKIEGGPTAGRSLYDNWMLETDAMFRTRSNLIRLGLMTKEDKTFSFDTEDLIGQACEVKVAYEDYEGEPRPRVKGFRGVTGDTLEAAIA